MLLLVLFRFGLLIKIYGDFMENSYALFCVFNIETGIRVTYAIDSYTVATSSAATATGVGCYCWLPPLLPIRYSFSFSNLIYLVIIPKFLICSANINHQCWMRQKKKKTTITTATQTVNAKKLISTAGHILSTQLLLNTSSSYALCDDCCCRSHWAIHAFCICIWMAIKIGKNQCNVRI